MCIRFIRLIANLQRIESKSRTSKKSQPKGISKMTSRVVVFQGRKGSHLSTPPTPFHKVRLDSNSTGSSFIADSAKPVALVVGSLDSR
jgi:hypothetical protein